MAKARRRKIAGPHADEEVGFFSPVPRRQQWGEFYRAFGRDFLDNMALALPFFGAIAGLIGLAIVVMAWLLRAAEASAGRELAWGNALYATALLIKGGSGYEPISEMGRAVLLIDVAIGFVFLALLGGMLVAVVTHSFKRE